MFVLTAGIKIDLHATEIARFGKEEVSIVVVQYLPALVPSETACLLNSPGSIHRTPVWIFDLSQGFLLVVAR